MDQQPCKCKYSASIALSCMIGVLLSIYALNVELNAEDDSNYEALCDISESISCTKVFTSKYGRGFGIVGPIFGDKSILNQPNSVFGITFYILIAVLGFINNLKASRILLFAVITSNCLSIYLAYLLYFVLLDFCVVCVSMYGLNLFNLITAVKRHRLLKRELDVTEETDVSKKDN